MGDPDEQFEWPEEAEEVESGETEAEANVAGGLRPPDPPSPDADDERFIWNMGVLTRLRQRGMGAGLAFSDGVTNHVVTCLGILRAEGRQYIIGYLDSWGREGRGTFLEEGKNVAGVKARREEDDGTTWSVTHEEFFRVFDKLIFLSPDDGGREVYGRRAEEEGEGL